MCLRDMLRVFLATESPFVKRDDLLHAHKAYDTRVHVVRAAQPRLSMAMPDLSYACYEWTLLGYATFGISLTQATNGRKRQGRLRRVPALEKEREHKFAIHLPYRTC